MRWAPTILVYAMVLSLMPFCVFVVKHHPDERHYTDAAIQMLETGDYVTPRTAEGNLRFKKPILTYWAVAASYHVFGISSLSSRLPFVLAGVAICCLTYGIAQSIFGDRRTSTLALALCATHPAFLISAHRSMPDIMLTLSITLSVFGFVCMIKKKDQSWRFASIAYTGAGLAVLSKGLPGCVFLAVVLAVFFWRDRRYFLASWKQHLFGITIYAGISISWFAAVFIQHGWEVGAQFFGDQVAQRVNSPKWQPIIDFPQVLLMFVSGFAVVLLPLWKHRSEWNLKQFKDGQFPNAPIMILIAWCCVYLILASMVQRVNMRYQVTIAPLAAIFVSYLLNQIEISKFQLYLRQMAMRVLCVISAIAAVAWVCHMDRWNPTVLLLLVCFVIGVGGVLMTRTRRFEKVDIPIAFGSLLLATAVIGLTYGSYVHSFETRVVASIRASGLHKEPLFMLGKPAYAARIRVQSENEIEVVQRVSTKYWNDIVAEYKNPKCLLIANPKGDALELTKYQKTEFGYGMAAIDTGLLRFPMRHWMDSLIRKKSNTPVILAIRRDEPAKPAVHMANQYRNAR